MAEYYPLLSKAIAASGASSNEARAAIYTRARKALETQLTHLAPPDPQLIARETEALETAIAKIEAEAGLENDRQQREAVIADAQSAQTNAAQAKQADAPAAKNFGLPASSAAPLSMAPPPRGFTLPKLAGETKQSAGVVAPAKAEVRHDKDATEPRDEQGLIAKLKEFGRPLSPRLDRAAPASLHDGQPDVAVPSARPDDVTIAAAPDVAVDDDAEMLRPVAVAPMDVPVARERGFVFAAVIAGVVFAVAIAAYVLRDRPEDAAKLRAAANAERGEQPAAGKISERLADASGGHEVTKAMSEANQAAAAPQVQKAVIILEAPDEESKSKRFEGVVNWRLDGINPGPSQEIIPDIRGDIDLPDLKLKVSLVIYKNMDPALSASHIIQLKFEPATDSVFAGIAQTDMLAMRAGDDAAPEYLQGIPTPVMTNYFLYALAQNERAVATNLELLRNRKQFDVMLRMSNNLRARIAFEKGAGGDSVFADAREVLQ
jgi:hypothetical protein